MQQPLCLLSRTNACACCHPQEPAAWPAVRPPCRHQRPGPPGGECGCVAHTGGRPRQPATGKVVALSSGRGEGGAHMPHASNRWHHMPVGVCTRSCGRVACAGAPQWRRLPHPLPPGTPPLHTTSTPAVQRCTLRQRRASSAACYPAPCVSRAAYDPAHDHTTHAHTPTCPCPFPAPALQDGLLFPDQELALHPG
jgi:hypothetical protein